MVSHRRVATDRDRRKPRSFRRRSPPTIGDTGPFNLRIGLSCPRLSNAAAVRTPIDAFVLSRLEARGLTFNPEAPRAVLLRRLTFDLLGLPPTLEQQEQFLGDGRADAYERLVDRLLASPAYGERWGRHWLDIAGYADSDGGLAADRTRPEAWRYRDYVIQALNRDMPFDQFLTEQLAGDELGDWHGAESLDGRSGPPADGDRFPPHRERSHLSRLY